MTDKATGFDVKAALKPKAEAIVLALGERNIDQLRAMHAAEVGKGQFARKTVLAPIMQEIATREAAAPALTLPNAALERLAIALRKVTGETPPYPELSPEDKGKEIDRVLGVLTDPAPDFDCLDVRVVVVLAPMLIELEAAKAAHLPAHGETVPAKLAAEPEKKPENVLTQVSVLAFCDADVVRFKRAVTPDDFSIHGRKARFLKPTVLMREKPAVRIDTVVAMDEGGRALARCHWKVPLEGGGGRLGEFPAGFVAFDL